MVPTKICSYCGAEHSQKVPFCDECGSALEDADARQMDCHQPQSRYRSPQREQPPIPPGNTPLPYDRSEKPRVNRRIVVAVAVLIFFVAAQHAVSSHIADMSKGRSPYANLTLNSSTASATNTEDKSAQYTAELQQKNLTIIRPFSKEVNANGDDMYTATVTDEKFVYDVTYEFTWNQSETQTRYDEIVQSLQKEGYIVGQDTGEMWTGYNVGFAATVKNAGIDVVVIRAKVDVNYFIPLPIRF